MTLTSSRTSPAAASGSWMPKAFIAAQTASSWQSQPRSWKLTAVAGRHRAAQDGEPAARLGRAAAARGRDPRAPGCCADAPPTRASAKAASPIPSTTASVISAQCGTSAADSTQTTRAMAGKRSNMRWANDGADQRRPEAAPARQPSREDGDAADLADPPGKHRVREQPHAEGREHEPEGRPRRLDRLADHGVPGEGADEHRDEVERDGERRPRASRRS